MVRVLGVAVIVYLLTHGHLYKPLYWRLLATFVTPFVSLLVLLAVVKPFI